MQQVSIQQAAVTALATYIRTTLVQQQGLTDLVVSDRWPDQKKLPPRSVTILLTGEMDTERADHLFPTSRVVVGNTVQRTFTVQQFFCIQPMQIDLWATSNVVLDDLIARHDDITNVGTSVLPGSFNEDPFGEGVVLLLGSKEAGGAQQLQWNSAVMYWFESFVVQNTPDQHQRQEYRATARGEAHFMYTSERKMSQLLQPTLKLKVFEVGDVSAPPTTQLFDIYAINNQGKGFNWSSGT